MYSHTVRQSAPRPAAHLEPATVLAAKLELFHSDVQSRPTATMYPASQTHAHNAYLVTSLPGGCQGHEELHMLRAAS